MQVNGIQSFQGLDAVNSVQNPQAHGSVYQDVQIPNDSFEYSAEKVESERSQEEKQQIVHNAKTKAAGWSCIFNILDTLYYGLRSKKTIAKKFDLDVEKDKDLIKVIKKEQVKSTLPAAIGSFFGVGLFAGLIGYVCNKVSNPDKIKV